MLESLSEEKQSELMIRKLILRKQRRYICNIVHVGERTVVNGQSMIEKPCEIQGFSYFAF